MNENKKLSLNRYINFIIKQLKELIFILKNINYLIKLIYCIIIRKPIFYINNAAIGHYPIDIYLCSKIYGKKSIFVFNSDVQFANQYLNYKFPESYNFNNKYEKVLKVQNSIEKLTYNFINFKKCPGILHMTEKLNYANFLDGNSKVFEFNDAENEKGLTYLKKNKIEKRKYVCFLLRTSEYYNYMNKDKREKEMAYRNINPINYIPTLEYLLNNNYKIIRMGKGVKSNFPFDHKNFINYALSEDRSDFLDIWLSAHCSFFLSSSTGLGVIPLLFNTPLICADNFPCLRTISWIPKSMHIPRLIMDKNNQLINIKEQFKKNLYWTNCNQALLDKLEVTILENEPDEIKKSIIEMEKKIKNGFDLSSLNLKFWHKTKIEWDKFSRMNKQNNKEFKFSDRFTFNYFHKIDGINTVLPDFYLNKYKDVFIDY